MLNIYVRAAVYMLVILTGLSCRFAVAEQGDWLVRARGIYVAPNDDSGLISLNGAPLAGSGVGVDSNPVPELDVTYMLWRNVGIEVIAGITNHEVDIEGPGPALALATAFSYPVYNYWCMEALVDGEIT